MQSFQDVFPQCNVEILLLDPDKNVVERRVGHNVWTLTGREYLVERMSLSAIFPARVEAREDCIYYMGVGQGAQTEVESVSSLVTPLPYRSGEFLAPVQTPPVYPADATGTPRTSVQYLREFASNEISIGTDEIITEAGLYTDGDPAAGDAPPAPTDYSTAAFRAPLAYHNFEPITKFIGFSLLFKWEVRIV